MKKIVILGAGTAGTLMANKLRPALAAKEWEITVVDREKIHYYQPGFLFIPFGIYNEKDVVKPVAQFIPKGVSLIRREIDQVAPEKNSVLLAGGGSLDYDLLIVATGTTLKISETPGLQDRLWKRSIFDFYTLEGSLALFNAFKDWPGGKLVTAITEIPFKCPVAPIEFVCLADAFFTDLGIRHKVEISLVTPLSGAFTKPVATRMLSDLLKKKNINVIPDFYIERIDNENKKLVSYDEKEVPFDILTIVPLNKGADFIGKSGLGDDMNFVPVDRETLQHQQYPNIFAIGDAAAIPTSKAGSVAHFAADVLFENLMSVINGRPVEARFNGHANCFIETGFGKGVLIDFNYETEPVPGSFPLRFIGPFRLLENTRLNHYGKMLFRWVYWNLLLKGRHIPFVDSAMSLSGKQHVNTL